jgi:hypothetical protein
MKIFYDTLEALHQFSVSLDHHELTCTSCKARGQFVSHGFCYKQRSQTVREAVGKRLFCSKRSGRTGCGRTVQLYIATEVPKLHYGTTQLFAFINALLANFSIAAAYCKAVGKPESRHAWRWFKKVMLQLTAYRRYLHREAHVTSPAFKTQSQSRQILLPTLHALFSAEHSSINPIADFQQAHQVRFI